MITQTPVHPVTWFVCRLDHDGHTIKVRRSAFDLLSPVHAPSEPTAEIDGSDADSLPQLSLQDETDTAAAVASAADDDETSTSMTSSTTSGGSEEDDGGASMLSDLSDSQQQQQQHQQLQSASARMATRPRAVSSQLSQLLAQGGSANNTSSAKSQSSSASASASLSSSSSLVGRLVLIESGRHRGRTGQVLRGANGYLHVHLTMPAPDQPLCDGTCLC